jgi:DNA-binding GntR family transcriptional regulator
MILSGKLKKGDRLAYEDIAEHFNTSAPVVYKVISQLKEDGLIIPNKGKKGSFAVSADILKKFLDLHIHSRS